MFYTKLCSYIQTIFFWLQLRKNCVWFLIYKQSSCTREWNTYTYTSETVILAQIVCLMDLENVGRHIIEDGALTCYATSWDKRWPSANPFGNVSHWERSMAFPRLSQNQTLQNVYTDEWISINWRSINALLVIIDLRKKDWHVSLVVIISLLAVG